MQKYVLGFAFNDLDVLLIRKNRPDFMAGKLNGIGGEVEQGESLVDAMIREFADRADILTSPLDWRHVGSILGRVEDSSDCHIEIFVSSYIDISCAKSATDEEVVILPVDDEMISIQGVNGLYEFIVKCYGEIQNGGTSGVLPVSDILCSMTDDQLSVAVAALYDSELREELEAASHHRFNKYLK